jgi:hypothetical protein
MRRALAWFAEDKSRRRIDEKVNQEIDLIDQAYRNGKKG